MDRKKLDKLWQALSAARSSPQTADDLEHLASACGRELRKGGKHPMWITKWFLHRALPIPRHGGNPSVSPRVKKVILEGLEADAAAWEEHLLQSENGSPKGDR